MPVATRHVTGMRWRRLITVTVTRAYVDTYANASRQLFVEAEEHQRLSTHAKTNWPMTVIIITAYDTLRWPLAINGFTIIVRLLLALLLCVSSYLANVQRRIPRGALLSRIHVTAREWRDTLRYRATSALVHWRQLLTITGERIGGIEFGIGELFVTANAAGYGGTAKVSTPRHCRYVAAGTLIPDANGLLMPAFVARYHGSATIIIVIRHTPLQHCQ